MNNKQAIVISLGGSLVVPGLPAAASPQAMQAGDIDLNFLKKFQRVIKKYINPTSLKLRGARFFILVGGGKICRVYQNALLEFGAKAVDRDWIGIDISRLNAKIIKQMFVGNVYPEIITDPNKKIKTNKDVVVGAGWKPGWSTDYDSVLIAKTHNIKTIINLTNVDYVYDLPAGRQAKIPPDFTNAKPFKEIDWKSFQSIVGNKWEPGLSMPFDPRASKLAAKLRLKVVLINGKNLEQVENFLNNKPFVGTTIQ